jgi:hypothetical protein
VDSAEPVHAVPAEALRASLCLRDEEAAPTSESSRRCPIQTALCSAALRAVRAAHARRPGVADYLHGLSDQLLSEVPCTLWSLPPVSELLPL